MRLPRYIDPERLIEYARSHFRVGSESSATAAAELSDGQALLPSSPAPVAWPPAATSAEEIHDLVVAAIRSLERQSDWPTSFSDLRTKRVVEAVRVIVSRVSRKRAPRLGRNRLARKRRGLLAQALPARPRRRVDQADAINTLERLLGLHKTNPALVDRNVRAYLESASRTTPAPLFRDLGSAQDYVEFLAQLGYQTEHLMFCHYPALAPGGEVGKNSGTSLPIGQAPGERYWQDALPIARLLRRPAIQSAKPFGYLAIAVVPDGNGAATRPGKQRRGYGFRFGVFTFSVWVRAVSE